MAEPSPDLTVAASGLIGPALSALVGVLMRHSQLVQRGERRFLSPFLLLEIPTVAGMGIVGGGVGSYLELAPSVTWAVAAVLGWLGPQALALLVRAVAQRAGVKIDPDKAAPVMQTRQSKPLSQSIADAADLIDCVAQREAYRRATELIGPGLERITGRMPAGAMDGWTAPGHGTGLMFAINVQANLKPLMAGLDDLAKKQIPFATARALTAVAKKVQAAQTDAIADVFDRPTLFTQRSVGVKAAKKSDLTATVFVKDIAAKYLEPFELGGKHHLPASKRGGTLLNPKAIPLNQYGNLPKGKLRRLMGKPDVFVGTVAFKSGQTISGIWQRPPAGQRRADYKRGYRTEYGTKGKLGSVDGVKTGLKLLVRFGDALPVQQRLGYRERAKDVVQASLQAEFTKAMGEALATATRR